MRKLQTTPTKPPLKNTSSATFENIIGEVLWHSFTEDPEIQNVSSEHYKILLPMLKSLASGIGKELSELKVLELAAYAHNTGYLLSEKFGLKYVVSDISQNTLKLGRDIYGKEVTNVRRVALDFHELPFKENEFDFVWISSAIHHTWLWEDVLSEMVRVTAKDGHVYLHNEPCERGFCFYNFRSNRPHEFSHFENELEDRCLLRTISEPYFGSRQEALFQMIENQRIPLDSVLELLSVETSTLKIELCPEICMGEFEHALITKPFTSKQEIINFIYQNLDELKGITLGKLEEAQLFSLPNADDIDELIQTNIELIVQAREAKGDEQRLLMARLFGSPMYILAQKNLGSKLGDELNTFETLKDKEVNVCYPESVSSVLEKVNDLYPDMLASEEERLVSLFPSNDWSIYKEKNGGVILKPLKNEVSTSINLPKKFSKATVLARVYTGYQEEPYRLVLSLNGIPCTYHDVYKSDSLMFKEDIFEGFNELEVRLSVVGIDQNKPSFDEPPINVACLRIYYID